MVLSPFRPLNAAHHFTEHVSTTTDKHLVDILLGFWIGWTWWVAYEAFRQTQRIGRLTVFTFFAWSQIATSLFFIVLVWTLVNDKLQPSFAVYFFILLGWAVQIHFVAQVLVTRLCLLIQTKAERSRLRIGTSAWIALANLSCFCVWMPYHTQIGNKLVNKIVLPIDVIVSIMILAMDLYLNSLFIRVVRARLIQLGLHKYDRVVKFTLWTIGVVIFLDFFVIAFMWYPNAILYMSLYPIVYQIKLAIELSMSRLIVSVAKEHVIGDPGSSHHIESQSRGIMVRRDVQKQVEICHDWMGAKSRPRQRFAVGTEAVVSTHPQTNLENQTAHEIKCLPVVQYPPSTCGRSPLPLRQSSSIRNDYRSCQAVSATSFEMKGYDGRMGKCDVEETLVSFFPSSDMPEKTCDSDSSMKLASSSEDAGDAQPQNRLPEQEKVLLEQKKK